MKRTVILLLLGVGRGVAADRLYLEASRRANAAQAEQSRRDVMAWRRALQQQIDRGGAERDPRLEQELRAATEKLRAGGSAR